MHILFSSYIYIYTCIYVMCIEFNKWYVGKFVCMIFCMCVYLCISFYACISAYARIWPVVFFFCSLSPTSNGALGHRTFGLLLLCYWIVSVFFFFFVLVSSIFCCCCSSAALPAVNMMQRFHIHTLQAFQAILVGSAVIH